MNGYLTLPGEILALILLLVATFSALVGHTLTRWTYRSREQQLRTWQQRLNVQGGGPGYGGNDAPFVPGQLAELHRHARTLVNGRPR